jgi:hypothetical protein
MNLNRTVKYEFHHPVCIIVAMHAKSFQIISTNRNFTVIQGLFIPTFIHLPLDLGVVIGL